MGFDEGVGLVDLSVFSDCKTDFGSEPISFDFLKTLCVSSLLEGVGPSALSENLGGCELDLPLSKSSYALGNLGFASPPIVQIVPSRGYFLCSCVKVFKVDFEKDLGSGIPSLVGDCLSPILTMDVVDCLGELRAVDSPVVVS